MATESILRKHETVGGCELCGETHLLSYGGVYACQPKGVHHPLNEIDAPLRGFPNWDESEREAVKAWIVARDKKDAILKSQVNKEASFTRRHEY